MDTKVMLINLVMDLILRTLVSMREGEMGNVLKLTDICMAGMKYVFDRPYLLDEESGGSSDTMESKNNVRQKNESSSNGSKILAASPLPSTTQTVRDDSQKKTRELYGPNEHCYVMDAKSTGNIGRYLNVIF